MQSDITQFQAILNRVCAEKDEAIQNATKWAVDQSLLALRQQEEIERLRAELAAAIKQRDEAQGQTWYLLYGGSSEDGMGTGHYIGRTTDKEVARKHHAELRKSPYNIGYVEIVTDTEKKRVSYYGTELQPKKQGGGA